MHYSTLLFDKNKPPSITPKPREPRETDYALHPVTQETTSRLAYSREPPPLGMHVFDMDMTKEGRQQFQQDLAKYNQDDARHHTKLKNPD